jgi:acetyltransferase-like isoleucine patch superfamily enzyme
VSAADTHQFLRETRDRAFSVAVKRSFARFGSRSRLSLPIQLHHAERMSIGSRVYLGPGCWLLTHDPGGQLEIGDGTSIAGYCVLSAAVSVQVGNKVLFARNVYVADHRHGFERPDVPVIDQPITELRPIVIEDGAWLGQNVVVLPGVTVGRNAVVGANSVVRDDVPPHSVAVGAPARICSRAGPGHPAGDLVIR